MLVRLDVHIVLPIEAVDPLAAHQTTTNSAFYVGTTGETVGLSDNPPHPAYSVFYPSAPHLVVPRV